MGKVRDFLKRSNYFASRFFSAGRNIPSAKTSDPFLADFFGLTGGGSVSQAEASSLPVAQACITATSQTLASVPLTLYRRGSDGSAEKATDHPLYEVLHDIANPACTAFEAREILTASIMVSGNGYARIRWNQRGQVIGLEPLEPHNVTVERLESGRLRYKVTNWNRASAQVYSQEDILHVRWRLGRSGIVGQSPVECASRAFQLALAQQETAGYQSEKAFRPEGVLSVPSTRLTDASSEIIMDKLAAKIERGGSTGGLLIMDGETKWQPLAFSSKDAEFLESRKLSNLDICRIWGVPPTVAGIVDGATYSNVQGETQAFVTRCLAPMAKRIEAAMTAQLLPELSRQSLYIEHDLQGLLRGDLATRYAAYGVGIQNGFLTGNQVAGFENLPRFEGGDEHLRPLNMTPLNTKQPVIA